MLGVPPVTFAHVLHFVNPVPKQLRQPLVQAWQLQVEESMYVPVGQVDLHMLSYKYSIPYGPHPVQLVVFGLQFKHSVHLADPHGKQVLLAFS